MGRQGRLVIPAGLRKALGLEAGDRLVIRQVGNALVLERREAIARRLQDRFRKVSRETSLVDELIARRRSEAAAESRQP